MMDADETFAQLQRLLRLMPGVDIAWAQQTQSTFRIGLEICLPASLACLSHIARDANVPLHVEVDWHWKGQLDDPACLRYDLRVPRDTFPDEPLLKLQVFGGFLVRHLRSRGILQPDDAAQLLRTWNWVDE